MKAIKIVGFIGALSMIIVLLYGFIVGDFFVDGSVILSNPWGIVSLVDLYVGFALFSCWIVLREPFGIGVIIWVVLMMVFGFLTGAVYLLYAIYTSDDDIKRLMLGKMV